MPRHLSQHVVHAKDLEIVSDRYGALYNFDSRAARDFAPAHLNKNKKRQQKYSEIFGQYNASHVATSV